MMDGIARSGESAYQNARPTLPHNNPQPHPYYCSECDRGFRRPSELRRHLTQTILHNPYARMFACDKCSKHFTQPYNLEKHQRLHSGLPDRCDLPFCENNDDRCQQEFNDESNFRAHIRQQHIEKFDTVPVWLNDAIQHRLGSLKTKSNRRRRPILKHGSGNFIYETFPVSGSSSSPPPPRPTDIRAVSGSSSFVESIPSRLDLSTPISLGSILAGAPSTASQTEALWKQWDLSISKYLDPGMFPVMVNVNQFFWMPLVN